jgi:hypothetical protein
MPWIKNTAGTSDAMLTFATVAFIIVTLNIFLSSFGSVDIAGMSLHFQVLDSSIMAVYLGATFTAYVSRRFTDTKYGTSDNSGVVEEVVSEITGAASQLADNSAKK